MLGKWERESVNTVDWNGEHIEHICYSKVAELWHHYPFLILLAWPTFFNSDLAPLLFTSSLFMPIYYID